MTDRLNPVWDMVFGELTEYIHGQLGGEKFRGEYKIIVEGYDGADYRHYGLPQTTVTLIHDGKATHQLTVGKSHFQSED